MRAALLLAPLLVALVALAPTARGGIFIYEWNTTAAFDLGTKTTSNDVAALETRTDNPGIPADRLAPASVYGDAFRRASADAETFKWIAASCDQSQGQQFIQAPATTVWFNTSLGNLPIPGGDGVLAFHHKSKVVANSSRYSSIYVAGTGSFVYHWEVDLGSWHVATGTKNLTLALTNAPASWCAGYTAVGWEQGFGIFFVSVPLLSIVLVAAQAFTVRDGVMSLCGDAAIWGDGERASFTVSVLRVVGQIPAFIVVFGDGTQYRTCETRYLGPVYASMSFRTNGAGLAPGGWVHFRSVSSSWFEGKEHLAGISGAFITPPILQTAWTSQAVLGADVRPYRTIIRIVNPGYVFGYRWTLCDVAVLDAAGAVLEQQAVCTNPLFFKDPVYEHWVNWTTPSKCPCRTYFEFGGDSDYGPYIASVRFIATDGLGVSQPPGKIDPDNTWLSPVMGNILPLGVFCGVGAMAFIAVLAFIRRVRGEG